MGRVTVKNGIGYSESTRAAYIDMAAVANSATANPIRPIPEDPWIDRYSVWARWGADNLLPQRMYEDIENCGILNSIIDGKGRFAQCNGMLPALVHYDTTGQMVIDEIVTEAEIDDFLEDNVHFYQTFAWMKDQCGFATGVARLMLSKDRQSIAAFQRDDVAEMRYERQDPATGLINRIFLCAYWDRVGNNINDNRIIKLPLLNWNNPLKDLREKANAGSVEFAMTFKYPAWGKKYYPIPLWHAAYKWVKIAQGVPEMKAAMFENNFRPKYLVVISEKYWEKVFLYDEKAKGGQVKNLEDYTEQQLAEKKNKVYDDIDEHLAGNANAYKTVFVDGYHTMDGKLVPEIEIRPIDDTTKAGELLPDSAAANSEIAFAMLFNPAILGANMPSGPYTNSQGGSNVRESTLMQVIIHELERRNVRQVMNVIKRFNQWDKKYVKDPKQKLEFIIPATIPTTLDTGSNVKPMVTGASPTNNTPSNQNSNNGTP